MTTGDGLRRNVIGTGLMLVLIWSPFVYGATQEPNSRSSGDGASQNAAAPQPPSDAPAALPAATSVLPQASSDPLPDSPGTVQRQSAQSPPQQTPAVVAQEQPQERPHEPLGTAAAESMPTMGVAASRPAGAALAPAKQRNARSILIKVGAVIGVGVAVGTTMALSQGSPSKPPGSH